MSAERERVAAWDYLPHDQARSRAYRWGEDGLAGFCDIEQRLCRTGSSRCTMRKRIPTSF